MQAICSCSATDIRKTAWSYMNISLTEYRVALRVSKQVYGLKSLLLVSNTSCDMLFGLVSTCYRSDKSCDPPIG